MSAVRRQQQYIVDDNAQTQYIPSGAVRRAAAPLRAVPQTAPAPRRQQTPYREGREAQPVRARTPLAMTDPSHILTTVLLIGALTIVLYLGITSLVARVQVQLDDMQYGRPRTTQLDAAVGHNEAGGTLTHFTVMNLNRRVTVIEFPGGDVTKPQVIVGPTLNGRDDDLRVIKLRVEDINGDDKPDLTVQVKDERLVYINDGNAFRPITTEELAQVKQQGGR